MQVAVSGVDEIRYHQWVDSSNSLGCSPAWVGADRFVELLDRHPSDVDTEAVWLFQSPAMAVIEAVQSGSQDAESVLQGWWERNHAILHFHRRHPGQLRLVHVDDMLRPAPTEQEAECMEEAESDASDMAANVEDIRATQQLLHWVMEWVEPRYIELFDGLKASCSAVSGGERRVCAVDGTGTSQGVAGILDTALSGVRAQNHLRLLERISHKRDAELEQARNVANESSHESELLFLQLHSSQDELRQYAERNQALSASMASREDELQKLLADRDKLSTQIDCTEKALQDAVRRGNALEEQAAFQQWQVKTATKQLSLRVDAVRRRDNGDFMRRLMHRMFRMMGKTSVGDRMQMLVEELRQSQWFDADWYLKSNEDVRLSGVDPAQHYCDVGWVQGRNPGPGFDTWHYLRHNPDVADSGLNPLWHFIRHGQAEGRTPCAS